MAEEVYLRPDSNAEQATLLVADEEGRLLGSPETVPLGSAGASTGDRKLTVLLPADEFVTCQAKLPAGSPSRLRQMLAFSLEDEFAGDIDGLHFAAGARNDQDAIAVSVIARERFRYWQDQLAAAGLKPKQIVSEADAIPDLPGRTTVYIEGSRILGRRPGHSPFCFDELNLSELWDLLEAEQEDATDLKTVQLSVDEQTFAQRSAEIDAWRSRIDDLDLRQFADGCLPHLVANIAVNPGTNLLQGSFAPRSNYLAMARPWRSAAALLVAFVIFSVAGKAAEVWKLSRDQAQLSEEVATICAANYSSSSASGCEREMMQRLATSALQPGGGDTGFLAMMSAVGQAGGDALTVETISYRNGVLGLELIVPTIPYLDAFNEGVAGAGPFTSRPGYTESAPEGGYDVRVDIVLQ